MVQYIITPWRSRAELLAVRDDLYPSELHSPTAYEKQRKAVERISVWTRRGNCPHLIEATAVLVAAQLEDVEGLGKACDTGKRKRGHVDGVRRTSVRHAYALGFSRFVTGLLDSHQTGAQKRNMFTVARALGLPDTFVELRHQVIHEELPSLQVLRRATVKALVWIWNFYWKTLQAQDAADGTGLVQEGQTCDEVLKDLLQELKNGEEIDFEEAKALLRQWREEDVSKAAALLDFGYDATAQLTLLRLVRSAFERATPTTTAKEDDVDLRMKRLDDFRREMAAMEMKVELPAPMEKTAEPKAITVDGTRSATKRGWSRWEGPWTPKPIGVV